MPTQGTKNRKQCWKNNAVVNQKFIMTLDQQRPAKEGDTLNFGATHAIAVGTDNLIEELKIPEDYWMTLQIGSREHRREGLTGETWKVPVGDFTNRALYTQFLLHRLSHELNSGEFITNDVGFSASVLCSRPKRNGGKRADAGPGEKIWDQMAKKSKCVCEIKTKMNCVAHKPLWQCENIQKYKQGKKIPLKISRKTGGKNSQQLKEAKKLHQEAGVLTSFWRTSTTAIVRLWGQHV